MVAEQLAILDGKNGTAASLLRFTSNLNIIVADNDKNFSPMVDHIQSLNLKHAKKLNFQFNTTISRTAYREANEEQKKVLR